MRLIRQNKRYVVTLAIEFVVLILSFFVYRLANSQMDDYGFGEYNLSRRTVSLLQPLLMIGLGVAVPRYISLYPNRSSIFSSALFLFAFSAVVICGALLGFQDYFSEKFYGDDGYSNYIFPLFLLLFGICFHAMNFGYLRGKQYVYFPNIIQLINIGVLPILVILYTSNIVEILYLNGLALIVSSLILSTYILVRTKFRFTIQKLLVDAKSLFRYGIYRVPGDFSLLLLISAPSYLVLELQEDILISGDVAYSITLLNLVGAAFGPLGLVMVPEIAALMTKGKFKSIEKRFYIFMGIGLGATALGYTIYYFFSEEILDIILGDGYRKSINDLSRVLLKASFGYALFIVLRNFLDAIHVKAINSINLFLSLAIYAILVSITYFNQGDIEDYLNAFVISVSFLGLITFIKAYRTVKNLS